MSREGIAPGNQEMEEIIIRLATATLGKKAGKIKPGDPLLSNHAGFDSFSLLEFVINLEDTFGLQIPDEDLDPDVFYSVETVASYLRARLEHRD